MRITAKCLATTSLVLVTTAFASSSWAAGLDATSAIDTVTVYPDGATVTRVIAVDLPSGDSTLIATDFPLGLDTSSIRVEGEGGAKLTIGTIDARTPRAAPVNLPELDKRMEALNDQRADLQGAIDSATARRILRKPPPPASATRARRGRLPNGARPLPPSARKLRAPTPPFATPRARCARSIGRSPSSKSSARPSRRTSSKSAWTSPRRQQPRRR